MSGLYNIVFGRNENSEQLLFILMHVQNFDPGRFRDIWVEQDGDVPIIRLHTRNGGGNRESYEAEIESMRAHPWFVKDEDDDYDSTYADFYFKPNLDQMPDDDIQLLVDTCREHVDMGEMWNEAIKRIGGG